MRFVCWLYILFLIQKFSQKGMCSNKNGQKFDRYMNVRSPSINKINLPLQNSQFRQHPEISTLLSPTKTSKPTAVLAKSSQQSPQASKKNHQKLMIKKPQTSKKHIGKKLKQTIVEEVKEQQTSPALELKKLMPKVQTVILETYKEQYAPLNPDQTEIWTNDFLDFLKLKNTLNRKPEQRREMEDNDEDKSYSKYFYGNILQNEQFQQQFLYNIMQRLCGKIKSTRLIYLWNPLHKTNIHQFIDEKPNLLFLVRTEQGSILAAFTQMPFKKPFPDSGPGALISLTNRKVFPVKQNARAISYDGTYVSFGNYELLIKGNEISSNLGNAGGFFESKGEKARILFNQGPKSTTKILQLQVFQIQT